jgi:hypothetical protein
LKKLAALIALAIFIAPFLLVNNSQLVVDASSNTVSGIITCDTTWTKANSPYYISGPVTVAQGITLTIEPGVHVIGNTYSYIDINGTLRAVGTADDLIQFYSSMIDFMPSSSNWNEQTGSGSIIEYAILGSINILYASPKLSYNSIGSIIHIDGGSPIISYNAIHSNVVNDGVIDIAGDSPTISNNEIEGQIYVEYGSPSICNNSITSNSFTYDPYSQQRYDHPLLDFPDIRLVNESISGIILGGTNGVRLVGWNWPYKTGYSYNAYIADNTITASLNCLWGLGYGVWAGPEGTATLERNKIYNCTTGIYVGGAVTISDNTISNNDIGLTVNTSRQVNINQNNIQDNNRTINSITKGTYDLTNNWWGTTNAQTIQQMLYRDQNNGTFNYQPYLTAANPDALPKPRDPAVRYMEPESPSPTPTANLSASPSEAATPPQTNADNPTSGTPAATGVEGNQQSWITANMDILFLTGIGVIIALLVILIALTLRKKS